MSINAKPLVWNEQLVNKFWDFYANCPEEYFTYKYGANIIETISDEIKKGAKVLDYGCGTGFIISHLLEKGYEIYGADSSVESIKFTNNKYADKNDFRGAYLLGEIVNLKEKFDVILVIEVIEHLSDHFLIELFQNVKSILNPGGKVIFTTPNNEDLERSVVYCPDCNHTFHRWQHVRQWTVDSLSYVLTINDFQNIKSYTTNFTIKNTKNIFKKINRFMRRPANAINPHLVAICSREEKETDNKKLK